MYEQSLIGKTVANGRVDEDDPCLKALAEIKVGLDEQIKLGRTSSRVGDVQKASKQAIFACSGDAAAAKLLETGAAAGHP